MLAEFVSPLARAGDTKLIVYVSASISGVSIWRYLAKERA
jgi:hypothetical protein